MQNYHIYSLRTHIEDTDFSGIVYHGSYINYFERARSEWAIAVGMDIQWQQHNKIRLIVHSLSINYQIPAGLHEQVEVVSQLKSISKASMIYKQYLRRTTQPDSILCTAMVKIACVNYALKPCRLPADARLEQLRRLIE